MAEASNTAISIHFNRATETLSTLLRYLVDNDDVEYENASDSIDDIMNHLGNAENHPHSNLLNIKQDLKLLNQKLRDYKESAKEEVIYRNQYLVTDIISINSLLNGIKRARSDELMLQHQLQNYDATYEQVRDALTRFHGRKRKTKRHRRRRKRKTKKHGRRRKRKSKKSKH